MDEEKLCFNGIDARTGNYLVSLRTDELVAVATGESPDSGVLRELKQRQFSAEASHFGAAEGVDVCDLAQAGWGVVFPATRPGSAEAIEQAAIVEALRPLLDLRRDQATRVDPELYRICDGPLGVRPNESKPAFLARHGAGPGPADPRKLPYYLLIVADPAAISYRFQAQVGVQRAVGRILFDTLDEYANYARSVVAAETGGVALPRRAAFFGVANADDTATRASAQHLVEPLAAALAADPRFAGWSIERAIGEGANRAALLDLISAGTAPALLFTASHGMGFPNGDPLQLRHQGALLCQDWPGPKAWRGRPVPEEFYLAGDHLPAATNLLGTIAFFFACYGAGTPEFDEYSRQGWTGRGPIAPQAFVAGLPRAMLNRPRGGALAVVGHVERVWGQSFLWEGSGEQGRTGRQTEVFESTLRSLLAGMPIGAAMEFFDERYAELSCDLSAQLEDRDNGLAVDDLALASLWTANNDARGYAIVGDPAVRLSVVDDDAARPRQQLQVTTRGPGAV